MGFGLMNSVTTMFPTSSALLCKYNITQNVRSRVKSAIGTKQVKHEGVRLVKPGVVVENIMDACNSIINFSQKSYMLTLFYISGV